MSDAAATLGARHGVPRVAGIGEPMTDGDAGLDRVLCSGASHSRPPSSLSALVDRPERAPSCWNFEHNRGGDGARGGSGYLIARICTAIFFATDWSISPRLTRSASSVRCLTGSLMRCAMSSDKSTAMNSEPATSAVVTWLV